MNAMIPFVGFPKMARLSREVVITEKIDGTNASIYIAPNGEPITLKSGRTVPFLVGSRTRWIFPESDNFGFARWAYEHAEQLLRLGPGQHFGEWWGAGIQRTYGLNHKRFSLFNAVRWANRAEEAGCFTVPILYQGIFHSEIVADAISRLREQGSLAAPGFMKPEGVVVYHTAAGIGFKKTLDGDDKPKGSVESA